MAKEQTQRVQLIRPEQVISEKSIRCLQELMEAIEAGEVTGLAFVVQRRGGSINTLYECRTSYPAMIGGVEWLKKRIMEDWLR